jgi:osmotically-inducible protein OsmY
MSWKLSAIAVSFVMVGGVGSASTDDRRDPQLVARAAAAVNSYTQLTIFDDVDLAVRDGAVTLAGSVTMPHKREDLERRVAGVNGVREVRNQIRVLPASTSDDQLRYQIARAIYDNPHFWNYAIGPNPPIHIIVERGHVTLAGVVNNDTDRTIARSLAHRFPALSVKNNLKTHAEVRDRLEAIK